MRFILSLFLALSAVTAKASPISDGTRDVVLHPANGDPITIAKVTFVPDGEEYRYAINWNDELFADHFLSMRPFKCLEGAEKLWCRVPYPYEIARTVKATELIDLEYDLMFVWKNEGEYGINLWNGVYYRLEADETKLVGVMHDIDMNVLASPPEDGNLRPVTDGDLEEADADSHWLPRLTVE